MSKKKLILGAIFAGIFTGAGTSQALQICPSYDNGGYIVDASGNPVCAPPQEKKPSKPATQEKQQVAKKPVQVNQEQKKQPQQTIVERKEKLYVDWGPYKQKSPQELLALIKSLLQQQAPVASYPQNAPVGCCYGKLVKPPTYKEIIIKYIKEDGGVKCEPKPPKFKTVEKKIVVVPGHYEYKITQPPKYKVKEEIVKLPPQTKWVTNNGIYCKVPIQLNPIKLERKVLVQPCKCEKVWIPPKTITVKVQVLEQNATCVKKYVPPKYGIAKEAFMVKGPQVIWDAVLCDVNLKPNEIKEIQKKLKELGYYKGPVNGKLDDTTLAAVIKFQVDHNLAAGNISIETLEALGLKKLAKNHVACEVKNLK